jgi:hypothetical protein
MRKDNDDNVAVSQCRRCRGYLGCYNTIYGGSFSGGGDLVLVALAMGVDGSFCATVTKMLVKAVVFVLAIPMLVVVVVVVVVMVIVVEKVTVDSGAKDVVVHRCGGTSLCLASLNMDAPCHTDSLF